MRAAAFPEAAAPLTAADHDLARAAVAALHEELTAYPKPGLVSPIDSGSHDDMDFALMCRSADALLEPFAALAAAGRAGRAFDEALLPLGIAAERRMLAATTGINTHRGAIFSLGMIVAALGRAKTRGLPSSSAAIRAILMQEWGQALEHHAARGLTARSHGAGVHRRTGHGGARHEAARGFPSVFEIGLPTYRGALRDGLDRNAAAVQTLFALMASVDDSTVLHRGGLDGHGFVRTASATFLAAGGCFRAGWRDEAEQLHRTFVARRLSAGGCADLLACAILLADQCPLDQTPSSAAPPRPSPRSPAAGESGR